MGFDFSLVTAPFRMQPGLRRLAPGTPQLTPSRPNGRHLREKVAVLGSFAAQALLTVPGFDERPVFRTVAAEAARDASPAFALDASGDELALRAPLLGWAIQGGAARGDGDPALGDLLRGLPPALRPAALLALAYEEDFAVIDTTTTSIPWLAVCLPSRWAPETKVGRPFAEVHAPVADNTTLVAAAASLARLVAGPERWERFVWTITPEPRLHQHPERAGTDWPAAGAAPLDEAARSLAEVASFRWERQTFIPIVGTPHALFTIHVQSLPLAEAIVTPEDARRVHAAVASMSANVIAYRGLGVARERLLHWLARRGADARPA
ncbi:MAG TPA: heme-dependent oxidative N-demethylase subunit alpha family protein [Caldimonas sp.]|jgi:hypothetical protein|nr:heme-dependent oxidative N-demethylase subunit alpha family protein [Caldimonas sp.]HEX2541566.1 heme-dependent oxidative N-demethylase subunit alpha family protein [Caldimonas sp.]